jgi:hypothetical protein
MLSIVLPFLLGLIFMSFVVLMTLLAIDVFTLPYLTPFAHFLATILSPFLPLMAPITLGMFLKICQHETFPKKKMWIFLTGGWCLNHVQRVCNNVSGLYLGKSDSGEMMFCGLNDCRGSWVEAGLLVVVVVGQWMGWRWDAGLVDKWVQLVVTQARKQEEEKRKKAEGSDVEKALISKNDKKGLVAEKEVVGGDMEKTGLLVGIGEKTIEKA